MFKTRSPHAKSKKLLIYKILIVVFVVVLLATPNSVTNMPEIETKLLITVLGVDKSDEGYEVSATAVMPQEGQNGAIKNLSIDAKGESVSKALSMLGTKMGKQLELGLCGLVVLGKNMMDGGIEENLSYLLASGTIIPGAHLVLSPESSARDTIEKSNRLSEASSNGLASLVEYNAHSSTVAAVTLLRFLSESHGARKSSFLPCIVIKDKSDGGENGGSEGGGSESGGAETEISSINTVALFVRDKIVRRLTPQETLGFTWSDRTSTRGAFTLDDFTVNGINVGKIYSQLKDKSFSLETRLDADVPSAKLRVKASIAIEDRRKITLLFKDKSISDDTLTKELLTQFARAIEDEMRLAVAAMAEEGCDAMGIVDNMYRMHFAAYKSYEDKENLLKNTAITYDVDVELL